MNRNTRVARYDSLDAWRGVACLMVILYHSTMMYRGHVVAARSGALETLASWIVTATSFGNAGVAVFFVISGYCIAAAGASVRSGRHSVGKYFLRRFRRIYPPLWAVIVLSCGFFVLVDVLLWPRLLSSEPWFQARPWWYSGWQWLGSLTLTETWRWHLVGNQRGHFPGQAWTLCYEEQFYAVTGLLLLMSRRWFFMGAAAVSVVTLGTAFGRARWAWPVDGFFFDGAWLLFAAGLIVYWALHEDDRWRFWSGIGLILIGTMLPVGIAGSKAAFVFAGALLALHRYDSAIAKSPWMWPMMVCGQMCYSLYLVHQLLVKAVSEALWQWGVQSALVTVGVVVPACLAVSVGAGRLCYLAIERRFLNTPPHAISALFRTPKVASPQAPRLSTS